MGRDVAHPSSRHGRPLECDVVTGSGSPVVLLHGVAFGPESFTDLTREHSGSTTFILPHRRGYGRSVALPAALDLQEQVADLVATIGAHVSEPVVVAGVSGGATLGIALALAHPGIVRRLVVHEPAIGPLGSGLATVLTGAAVAFREAGDPVVPATALARGLAGETTWARLPGAAARVREVAETMAIEVPHFAAFAPTAADLGALRAVPVISCVGRDSGPERYEVSRALIELVGAVEVAMPCAHLVQVEAPAAFASVIATELEGA